jgi:hypothetical protein
LRATHLTSLVAASIALAAVGCSSDSGQANDAATPAPAASSPVTEPGTSPAADPGVSPAASVDPDDPFGFGDDDATAVVTIGDERYEFSGLYCVTMFGALSAASVGGDPQVNIDLPPQDWETSGDEWEPPKVRVDGDEPYFQYKADPELAARGEAFAASRVESFTSDGFQGSGTAVFMDVNDFGPSPSPMAGTFEVSCPRP